VDPTGNLGKEDGGLRSFPLTEQHAVLSFGVRPVLKELPGDWGDACVLATAAPFRNVTTEIIDQAIAFTPFTGGVKVERDLL
jgi:hypothetical protein